jgi:ribonuclease Y
LRDLNLDTNPIITKNPEIKSHLVNLYFRHSYGQNQLEHSLEVADIAGRIAAEILPDQVAGAKLVGLLHDLGKASIGSTNHVDESIKLLQQYSEVPKPILNAIAEHHDTKPGSVLSAILQAADAISSGRPGARNPRSDQALIRQEKLEELISEYHDVDNVFALSGGREVHILIRNRNYSQSNMRQLLTNITKKIQDENLAYSPITITMIREDEIVQNLA